MTRTEWQEHARTAGDHDRTTCGECEKRRRTQKRNRNARELRAAMRDLGMYNTKEGAWE